MLGPTAAAAATLAESAAAAIAVAAVAIANAVDRNKRLAADADAVAAATNSLARLRRHSLRRAARRPPRSCPHPPAPPYKQPSLGTRQARLAQASTRAT